MLIKLSKTIYKRIIILVLVFAFIIIPKTIFAEESSDIENNDTLEKVETLSVLGIIDDKENLDLPLKRSEFAKMLVKSSDSKDKIISNITEAVCNDVGIDNPYAGYIKEAVDKGHMFLYLGGLFKPDEYVTYSDLSRAMLSLLSYTNDDFRGNQVIGRNLKFESLNLNEGIDKVNGDTLTKNDVVTGIYNTLREYPKEGSREYGLIVFDKLRIDKDNVLNINDMIETKVEGPFVIRDPNSITAPFEITEYNVYLNGLKSNINEVILDMENYGYVIFYLDLDRKLVYAYTERDDVKAPIRVEKGYVQGIYYAASDLTTPYRVDIDLNKYMLESEEMKFAFSPFGTFRENDYIIYLCNKMNDVTKAYRTSTGSLVRANDESEIYNGSIINAFSGEMIYEKEK